MSLDNAQPMVASELSSKIAALHGIKVLDLSRVLAGPWATQLLGDYGAEVIKVERPGRGDDTRSWGPPWLGQDKPERLQQDAAYYLSANRNKRSITVDFSKARGADLIQRLASNADVVVENFRVGSLAKFGLDYATLAELNSRLVYCSISGYGQTGRRAGEPAYDAMIQAAGGLMSITGAAEDDGGTPQKAGVAIADIMAGMYAVTAILSALLERGESDKGQHIDVPLYDSQVAWLANQAMNYLVGGEVPTRHGSGHPNLVPYQTFATSDGYLCIAVGTDLQFMRCMACLDLVELGSDARFANNAGRVKWREILVDSMAGKLRHRSTAQWLDMLRQHDVPAGPVNSLDTVLGDEYAVEKDLVRSVHHTTEGEIPTVANPVSYSRTPVQYRYAPPLLGEHTEEVLTEELGLNSGEISHLKDAGII